jgi:hypothetical protein
MIFGDEIVIFVIEVHHFSDDLLLVTEMVFTSMTHVVSSKSAARHA